MAVIVLVPKVRVTVVVAVAVVRVVVEEVAGAVDEGMMGTVV